MSGIVALWNLAGEPVDALVLETVCAAQAHRGPDGVGTWVEGSIAFAFQHLAVTPESLGETQPILYENVAVMFDGRLDNRRDCIDELRETGAHRNSSDAALVGLLYARFGESMIDRLSGEFALAVFDVSRRRLMLARDAIGTHPLYFAQHDATVVAASECGSILAHPKATPRPNADMLAAYFCACDGQEREGATFFAGVSCVLPGQVVTITPEASRKRIYWDFEPGEPIRFKSVDEYGEAFRHYFDQSITRRMRSAYPIAVSLSGGLDSGSVFCAAETLRRTQPTILPRVLGFHLQSEGPLSDESQFVDEIERRYGVVVGRLPVDPHFVTGSLKAGIRQMEAPFLRGFMDFTNPVATAARQAGARVVLTGLWGDQLLSSTAYWEDLFRQGRWTTLLRHVREFPRWYQTETSGLYARSLFQRLIRMPIPRKWMPGFRELRRRFRHDREWFTEGFWKRARQIELEQELRFDGKTAYERAVYGSVRSRYYRLAMDWSNKLLCHCGVEQASPFFDRDLISFLLRIPGDIPCADGVPKRLLRSAMTEALPPELSARRWKADATEQFDRGVKAEVALFEQAFGGRLFSSEFGYVDADRVRVAMSEVKRRPFDGGCAAAWMLADLLALEVWLQTFFARSLECTGGN